MACRAEACLARSTVSFGHESGCRFTGLGRETRTVPPVAAFRGAQVHRNRSLYLGNAAYPLATPPSRVVRMEEADERLLAVKGAIQRLCQLLNAPPGRKGTGVERGCEQRPAPKKTIGQPRGLGTVAVC